MVAKRKLGKTDIEVTPIGLGMMEFAGGGGLMGFAFPKVDQETKNATVQAGPDDGVNWFDTAEFYGRGVSEASLAEAFKVARKKDVDVVVATKWWPLFRTPCNIPKTIHDRLRFLGGYSISNYMVHQPVSFSRFAFGEVSFFAEFLNVTQGFFARQDISNRDVHFRMC